MIAIHTFDPNKSQFDAWLDNLLSNIQPLYLDIELYTRVFQNPDPEKMVRYRVETDFYCDSDPLIQLVRSLHRGATTTQGELNAALAAARAQSGYAKSVRIGVEALREASAFWRGEVDEPPDVSQG